MSNEDKSQIKIIYDINKNNEEYEQNEQNTQKVVLEPLRNKNIHPKVLKIVIKKWSK